METDEEKIEESFTPVEIILAFIIPFILFWGGMLSTVFFDNLWFYCFTTVPFYLYVFFGLVFSKEKVSGIWGSNALMSFFTSILLTVLIFVVPQNWETILNICRSGFVNLVVSFFFLIFTLIVIGLGKEKENFPWVLIPFLWW